MRHILFALSLFLIVLLSGVPAHSASISVGAAKDNTIYAESDGLSNGGGQRVFAGENGTGFVRRGLIKFDLTGITTGAIIDSVVLRMSVVQTHPTSVTVMLHRLLADWGEGTAAGTMGEGGGGIASVGDATWFHRFLPTVLWTTAGGEFAGVASASRTVVNIGAYTWRSSAMTADVAFWLANPTQNFGWEVRGDEFTSATAKAFGSRENVTVASRPLLTVYYSVPTAAGALTPTLLLLPVHPNPFNPSASIRYQLPATERVTVTVYNAVGHTVKTLVDGVMPAGTNEVVWHGDDAHGARVASGVYVVKLGTANAAPQTQKMVLLK